MLGHFKAWGGKSQSGSSLYVVPEEVNGHKGFWKEQYFALWSLPRDPTGTHFGGCITANKILANMCSDVTLEAVFIAVGSHFKIK
jgi:hypothetical protein